MILISIGTIHPHKVDRLAVIDIMREVQNIYPAVYSPIDNLVTYRALPTQHIEYIDPFLFLNHHGPQVYKPGNNGLPFGPHPHRGLETVTFILEGDIAHKDSSGHESVISAGGIQWMRAGSGLIHAEVSSDEFLEKGGNLEILQLWVNLPASLKMSEPFYKGYQKEEIPYVEYDDRKVKVNIIAGDWDGHEPAYRSPNGIHINTIYFKPGGEMRINVPVLHNIFFYVITGELNVNGTAVRALHVADFDHNGTELHITSALEGVLLLCHAMPFNEPVVAQGPFVMNTQEEITQAYDDYRKGKFGKWTH
jgi:redox-sensitive bicupin YhaK (pirin superfamily)